MPYEIPACAGKPYRPSNGIESLRFGEAFCDKCSRASENGEPCQIFDFAFWNDIGDADYPKEWVHDESGRPTCTAFSRQPDSSQADAAENTNG